MQNKSRPCVAVFLLEWDFQIHTAQLVEALVEQGFGVHLYLHGAENTGVHSPDGLKNLTGVEIFNSCSILTNELTNRFGKGSSSVLGRIKNRIYKAIDPLLFALGATGPASFAWTRKLWPIPIIRNGGYVFSIGVEDAGFVWACASQYGSSPVILYSLELFTEKHAMYYGWRFLALRRRARYWMRRAFGVIIQDRFRAKALLQSSGLKCPPKIYELPVSIRRREPLVEVVPLRKRLGIPDEEVVVVYVGNLTPIRMCVELCQQADALPAGCTLVFHGRWMGPPEYKEKLARFRDHPRVIFSEELVAEEQLGAFIDGCDIGLALYGRVDENYYHTGYASEKIALYFSRGIPVVTFDYPSNMDCFSRWDCGVAIAAIDGISSAVLEMMGNRSRYKLGAEAAFAECYDFESAKKVLCDLARDVCNVKERSGHGADV